MYLDEPFKLAPVLPTIAMFLFEIVFSTLLSVSKTIIFPLFSMISKALVKVVGSSSVRP